MTLGIYAGSRAAKIHADFPQMFAGLSSSRRWTRVSIRQTRPGEGTTSNRGFGVKFHVERAIRSVSIGFEDVCFQNLLKSTRRRDAARVQSPSGTIPRIIAWITPHRDQTTCFLNNSARASSHEELHVLFMKTVASFCNYASMPRIGVSIFDW